MDAANEGEPQGPILSRGAGNEAALSRREWIVAASGLMGAAVLRPRGLEAAGSDLPTRRGSSAAPSPRRGDRVVPEVDALAFDVFGTVVDWWGTIVREGERLSAEKGWNVDWGAFADAWRGGYGPAMGRVRSGELPWMTIDELHRLILDDLLEPYGLVGLSESEVDHLNRVWHRLSAWPDSVAGLRRLRSQYVLSTLSNGNVSLLVDMARNAGLPWDLVLSAEMAGHYKPDPEAYGLAPRLLDLPPERVLMVAAHKSDLRGAARAGLRTAWVARPLERGPDRPFDASPDPEFDLSATDFLDLAAQLGT